MGWGVYSNWRQIKSYQKNIRKTLLTKCSTGKTNSGLSPSPQLNSYKGAIHDKMLYNIQVRLSKMDHTIKIMQDMIQFNWLANNMILDAHVVINRLITGLIVSQK